MSFFYVHEHFVKLCQKFYVDYEIKNLHSHKLDFQQM